jgi:glycosyltransferase involved in cell wall biosynthesis
MEYKTSLVFLNLRAKAQRGGQEVTINNLIDGLKEYYDITYIGHPSDVNYKKVIFPFTPLLKLVPIKKGFGRLLKVSIFRYLFLRKIELNCDIIVVNGKSDYTFLLRNKKTIKYKKVLVIKHGRFINPYPDIIIKNKNYRIIVLNRNELDKLKETYGEENLKLIRTGIEFHNENSNNDIKQKFGIPKDVYIILSIGRLEEQQKKFSVGIRAIQLGLKKNKKLLYVIVGDGADRIEYENLIKKLDLTGSVKLVGKLSEEDKNGFLKISNLLLITSKWETLGLTMVEAFRGGVPVLTTKTDGSTDVIEEGYNGFYTTDEAKDIADKILEISNFPKEKIKEIVENAHKTAELYSYDKMINSYREVIKELINDDYNSKG